MTLVGPCKIECDEGCNVPEGVELEIVPMPRHAWSDIIVCPNARADGMTPCGLVFCVVDRGEP